MTAYVVGVDGGNSKTDIVLADDTGRVLARVLVAGTQPQRNGTAETMQSLVDGVQLAVERASLPLSTNISVAVFCLANVDTEDQEVVALDSLQQVAEKVLVHNDTYAVLAAGASAGWGVAVVAGAGINAVGRHPDGRVHRFLALGPETGDWGGGWAVAIAGLGAAVRAGDGRGRPTVLRTAIASALGQADVESIAIDVDRGAVPDRDLLGLAPVVLEAANGGDEVATAIVVRLADEVVDFAGAALRRLDLLGSDAEIILGGGMLQSGNQILLDRIRARLTELAPGVSVSVLDVSPVAGPVADALLAAGSGPDDVGRARAALRHSP